MNIGAVIELDFGEVTDPSARFKLIRGNVAERLHEIPVLTQRLVRAPFDLTWPALVPDTSIDIDRHISRVALPSPGTADQFDTVVSEFLSRPLVRTRPLWQLMIIEGLEDGRAATVLKVHHALADGVSGAETFASLFDITPEVRDPLPNAATDKESSATNSMSLVWEGLRRVRSDPALALHVVTSWFARVFNVVATTVRVVLTRGRNRTTPNQPSIFEARRTSLNGRAGLEKTYHRMRVPLTDAKRAAKYHGASVTDFVIATTSGALRRLLDERGEVLRRDLIAFVPINVRGDGDTAAMGNQISGMLVALHTDIEDPVERLMMIALDSAKTVGVQRQHGAEMFQAMPRVLGPTVLSIGGKLVDAFGLFDVMPPMANLMLSSVPGPAIPLWLSGHRVVSAAPVGPLLGPFALNVTVLGFEQNLEFGMLGCARTMPDLSKLREFLKEEAFKIIATAND
jgi:diacylglycerol O-acyltransferase